MKRIVNTVIRFCVAAFVAAVLFPSCIESETLPEDSSIYDQLVSFIDTKSDYYAVTSEDIERYVSEKQRCSTDNAFEVKSIVPYYAKSGELSSYVINYENGWEIVAADKRGPAVLASSEEGAFIYEELPPAAKWYLDDLNEEVDAFRRENSVKSANKPLSVEQEANLAFWNSFLPQEDREPDIHSDVNMRYPGYWVLVDTQRRDYYYMMVYPIVEVNWDQGSPYNQYCPYYSPALQERTAAGCVAVAGAQLIHYFHNHFGRPTKAPAGAITSGYVSDLGGANTACMTVTKYNTTIWDSMANNPDSSSIIIAHIGRKINTLYGTQMSTAFTDNLVYFIRDSCQIACSCKDYQNSLDTALVISNLNAGLPVLAEAQLDNTTTHHTFIINSWWQKRYQYTYTYEFVFYNPDEVPEGYYVPDKVEVEYSSILSRYYTMNWGWGGSYNQTKFLANYSWHPGGDQYNTNRYIYYNFYCL